MNASACLKAGVIAKNSLNIYLNPVRAKMVDDPADYEWSSYLFYIGRKESPAWLFTAFILGGFGEREKMTQKRYRDFVQRLIGK